MVAIASMLDDETIDFMASTFAAFPLPPSRSPDEIAALAEDAPRFRKGQDIAQQGIAENRMTACSTCHGALGEGNAELGPRLAG